MILDEIYEAIKRFRENDEYCPFLIAFKPNHCYICHFLFPNVPIKNREMTCPCYYLHEDYVESEMRRLFP